MKKMHGIILQLRDNATDENQNVVNCMGLDSGHAKFCEKILEILPNAFADSASQFSLMLHEFCALFSMLNYSVRQKKVSPKVICHFLSNHLEFLREILHVCYLFICT